MSELLSILRADGVWIKRSFETFQENRCIVWDTITTIKILPPYIIKLYHVQRCDELLQDGVLYHFSDNTNYDMLHCLPNFNSCFCSVCFKFNNGNTFF